MCSLRTDTGGVQVGFFCLLVTLVVPSGVCQPILPMPMGCVMTVRRPSSTSPFFSLAGFGIIEHAQLREIHYQAFARSIRQHELSRHDDGAANAGQPRIDARIGADDLFVADVEAAGDVGKRVLTLHVRDLQLADDFVLLGIETEFVGRHRRLNWRRRRVAAAAWARHVG